MGAGYHTFRKTAKVRMVVNYLAADNRDNFNHMQCISTVWVLQGPGDVVCCVTFVRWQSSQHWGLEFPLGRDVACRRAHICLVGQASPNVRRYSVDLSCTSSALTFAFNSFSWRWRRLVIVCGHGTLYEGSRKVTRLTNAGESAIEMGSMFSAIRFPMRGSILSALVVLTGRDPLLNGAIFGCLSLETFTFASIVCCVSRWRLSSAVITNLLATQLTFCSRRVLHVVSHSRLLQHRTLLVWTTPFCLVRTWISCLSRN